MIVKRNGCIFKKYIRPTCTSFKGSYFLLVIVTALYLFANSNAINADCRFCTNYQRTTEKERNEKKKNQQLHQKFIMILILLKLFSILFGTLVQKNKITLFGNEYLTVKCKLKQVYGWKWKK